MVTGWFNLNLSKEKNLKQILVSLLLVSFVTLGAGQSVKNKPDLSGNWKLVESPKQNLPNSRMLNAGDTLVVVQHEPEIKMSSKFTVDGQESINELVYFGDGRGETNTGANRNQSVASVTKWNGNKLTTKYSIPISFRGPTGGTKNGKMEVTQKWEISKDGTKLTQTTSVTGSPEIPPFNLLTEPLEMKYVYIREP